MVHVGKGIYARFRIVVHFAVHAIHHARSTGSRSDLTRIEHVQRQGIIRLIACTVCNRCAFFQSQFLRCGNAHASLFGEGRFDICNQRVVEAIVIHQEVSHAVVLEIPEHAFRKSGDGSTDFSAQFHGNVITRKHDFINPLVQLRLVLLHPSQFGSGEIARRIQQMRKTALLSQRLECTLSVRHGTRIAPDNRRTQHVLILIYTHQPVHLVRDTDCLDFTCVYTRFCHNRLRGEFQVLPPAFRILFRPALFYCDDDSFCLREEGRRHTFACLSVHQTRFYGRASNVIA